MVKRFKFLLCMIMLLTAASMSAQTTTSSLSGKVVDDKNEAVIGATVIAVHEPSGTKYGAVTNIDGRYTIQGMRTGGPYTVKISYIGYKDVVNKDQYLQLGGNLYINANLEPTSQQLQEVVVTGDAVNTPKTGAGSNFNMTKIDATPTVSRDIYDVVKNMPMAQTNKIGGISFAGSNNRYNSFQIDGTVSNDVFGLTSSGTNGGQTGANPISLDAIQEIQVVIAPFDVRESGFTGGGINAITKQGTNKFHASVYSFYTDENLYGRYNASKDYIKEKLSDQSTKTYGGSISGPLIKDKLFFFGNVEYTKQSYPSRYYPGWTSKYLTADMAQQVVDKYKTYTGVQEGYAAQDVDTKSLGILARLDWNIDDNNKLAFRYQHNNSSQNEYGPGSSTYYFANSSYMMKNKTNSFVLEANSKISNSWYNELRLSATYVRDHREVPYQGANVYIRGAADNNYTNIDLGTEYSSGANMLNQDIYSLEDNLSLYAGNHTFTFGTHNELFYMKNEFVQANNGAWSFSSLTDFLNDNPYQFTYKYTDPTGYIPHFHAGQFGIYAQDKWDVNNNLVIRYGVRLDVPQIMDDPTRNDVFNAYSASKGFGVQVGEVPSAKLMVSPRLGFRWFLNDSHATLVRGGAGLFTGRVPFVWLSNCFTNNGIQQKGTTITKNVPGMSKYGKDPVAAMNSTTGSAAKPDICTANKDFKYPQVLRADLAVEQKLPGDVKFTVEGLYSKTLNNVYFKNLALAQSGKIYAISGNEASAMPFYTIESSPYNSIINLSNTSKGYTYSVSGTLEKNFDFGLNLMASYTFGHSKSIYDGTSSVAYSNWKYNYAYDSNNCDLSYSTFDIPHRVVASVSYTSPAYLNGFLRTTIGVIYTGSTGMRYSLTMSEAKDYNGDGQRGNSLLYIPTASEVASMNFTDITNSDKTITTADEQRTLFENWIEGNSYASNHRGEYSKRNCCSAPWENRVDLHLAEDINVVKAWGGKIQITADVINFANLLNKKWGVSYSSTYNVTPLSVTKIAGSGDSRVATFNYYSNNAVSKNDIYSRWHAQIGVKLIF
jgi:hypothetical protein